MLDNKRPGHDSLVEILDLDSLAKILLITYRVSGPLSHLVLSRVCTSFQKIINDKKNERKRDQYIEHIMLLIKKILKDASLIEYLTDADIVHITNKINALSKMSSFDIDAIKDVVSSTFNGKEVFDKRVKKYLIISTCIKEALKHISEYLIIPRGSTKIGEKAFYRCSGLARVTIPSSVTQIDVYAFYGCSSLTSMSIHLV